jgi:hypothetical protein
MPHTIEHSQALPSSYISLDQAHRQQRRIPGNLLFHGDQFVHVPVSPHETTTKKLGFRACEPYSEVARQFGCETLLSATSHAKQAWRIGELTIFVHQTIQVDQCGGEMGGYGSRMVRVELDIPFRLIECEVSNDLVCC